MAEFPQFNNAKLMIAASIRHCRTAIEDLPVGQIVVDKEGNIINVDASTREALGLENVDGMKVSALLVDAEKVFPQKLSLAFVGDLGVAAFPSAKGGRLPARIVCVPGAHRDTFLLSIVFG